MTRSLRGHLAVAILFLLLGTGNLLYGKHKHQEYDALLSRAVSELTSPKETLPRVPFSPTVNIDQQSHHINRLRSRTEYYEVVVSGGRIFLGLSAAILLWILLVLYQQKRQRDMP